MGGVCQDGRDGAEMTEGLLDGFFFSIFFIRWLLFCRRWSCLGPFREGGTLGEDVGGLAVE